MKLRKIKLHSNCENINFMMNTNLNKILFLFGKKQINKVKLLNFILNVTHILVNRLTFDLIKLNSFLKKNKRIKNILLAPTRGEVKYPPMIHGEDYKYNIFNKFKGYRFPEVYVAQINDATILGLSGFTFLFKKRIAITHDLFEYKLDKIPEEIHSNFKVSYSGKLRVRFSSYFMAYGYIAKAASFVDPLALNYAHWMTEVLPRIAAFCENNEYKNVPIIINAGLHKNIIDSLSRIVGSRVIFLLPPHACVRVDDLLVTSVAGYISYEPKFRSLNPSSSGIFNSKAIQIIISKYKLLNDKKNCPSKIYLRRKSSYRQLLNQDEVETFLIKHGFTIIETDKLTFMDQVRYFSKAKHIIGPTGASWANLIFCNKKVNLAILVNDDKNMIFEYWVNLASIIGVKINYVIGKSQKNGGNGIHNNFYVNIKLIQNYIDSIYQ